jgi:hypothetical protein
VTARKEGSNQLNYAPSLFPYRYWKPAYLLAFLTFNRFACIGLVNPVEPNSEVNGHHGHQIKPPSKTVMQAKTNPEQLSLPRQWIVAERRLIRQALTRMRVGVLGFPLLEHSWFQVRWCTSDRFIRISAPRITVKLRRFRFPSQN